MHTPRRICFVTGTRAEFGLMRPVLQAIKEHKWLRLQLVVTGMHLDRAHGRSIEEIRKQGWKVDAEVPWASGSEPTQIAAATGRAMMLLAETFARLKSEIVIVVGDRVEAFAAASAAHIAGRLVAHVHGGDRALGQVDDALRHAITKLSHIHFPATGESAQRIEKLGDDPRRIHLVGSPGVDGIVQEAMGFDEHQPITKAARERGYGLLVYHPTDTNEWAEERRIKTILRAALAGGLEQIVCVYPNNDPGSRGIVRTLQTLENPRVILHRNLSRPAFLGLMRDAAMLLGNSSSGIIEAASFGTPVIDIGPRQEGRQRGQNVTTVDHVHQAIKSAITRIWQKGRPVRYPCVNLYGAGTTGNAIASTLATLPVIDWLRRKLISY